MDQPSPLERGVSSVLGVFAGTGRGAVIGALIGTGVCFLAFMSYLAYDLVTGSGRGLSHRAIVAVLLFGAAWFGFASLHLGGIVGAFLGAMVGALFPVRRGPR